MKLFLSLLMAGVLWSLTSCDRCRYLDCISSDYAGRFRIVSTLDGRDLVFGPSATYEKSGIKFYTLTGTDTSFFPWRPEYLPGTGYDSIVSVIFYPAPATPVFLRLNIMDTDTLLLTYNNYDTRCCGNITEITNIRYNNTQDLTPEGFVRVIKK